jgi:hypothetical protein
MSKNSKTKKTKIVRGSSVRHVIKYKIYPTLFVILRIFNFALCKWTIKNKNHYKIFLIKNLEHIADEESIMPLIINS